MKLSTRFSTFASFSLCIYTGLVQAQVHLPFSRQVRNVLVGRDSNPSLSLWGSDYVYVVNATVGTPGQSVSLVISPSTSDTWVPDTSSSYCNHTEYHYNYDDDGYSSFDDYNVTYSTYCLWGSFDKSASSTYQRANSAYRSWSNYYPDGTYMDGYNFTDTLNIGDVTLDNLPMGLADSSEQWIGALGLGANSSYYGGTYDNFPDRLVQDGTIKTKAYSIWLDAEDGSSGSLLMGAVDTSRYDGTLTRLDAYGVSSFYNTFGVSVTGINGSSSSSATAEAFTTNELPFPASLGPGETFSNLPDVLAQRFWSMAGATYNSTIRLATIPCDAAAKATDGGARFAFQLAGTGGPVLDVRLTDLILAQNVAAAMWGADSPDAAPPNTCFFAVQNGSTWGTSSDSYSSYEYYNLGAALLRRSYMVFDLVNSEVALAPVKFGTAAASNVVPFSSYGAVAPSATVYCTGSGYSCGSSTTSTPGYGSGSSDNGTGVYFLDTGLVAGLSVAFGLLTVVALLGAFAVWRKLLSKKSAKEVESDAERGDDHSVATDQTPVTQVGQGRPAGALPTVREEMMETSRDHVPQLAPLPVAAHEDGEGASHWPLQGSSSGSEAHSRSLQPESLVDHAAAGSQEEQSTGETPPTLDKGKGKETATHEDH